MKTDIGRLNLRNLYLKLFAQLFHNPAREAKIIIPPERFHHGLVLFQYFLL